MKILLLGGTGVIGTYLVQLLEDRGYETYVTSRSHHDNFGNVHFLLGNAKDDSFLRDVCKSNEWDAIVDFMSYKTDEFSKRVDLLLSSTKQYLFISSARVYGNLEIPIKESSPRLLDSSTDKDFLNTDEYSLTKARQENILYNSPYSNYTIVRPCITYGYNRLQLGVLEKEEWLYRAIHGRSIIMCKEILERKTTMTLSTDVCKVLCALIGNKESIGQTYHITTPECRTWKDIFEIYNSSFFSITGKHLKLEIVSLNDFLSTRWKNLRYQVIYDRVYDRVYDTSKIQTLVDVDKFTKLEDGLKSSLEKFMQNPKFKNFNWGLEAYKDKLSRESTPMSEIKGIKKKLEYLIKRCL